jgi:hypothetical protein
MSNRNPNRPSWALDVAFATVLGGLLAGALKDGVKIGGPIEQGTSSVLLGLYVLCWGALVIASYYFPGRSYLLRGLMWCCENVSTPRGAWTAFLWGALGLTLGSVGVLAGLGLVQHRSLPTAEPPQPMRLHPPPAGFDDCARGILGTSMPVDEAERLLRCTKIFAVGGMPDKKPVQAFNVLFEEPDATTRFRTLAVQGQTAGRLYALAALLLLDPTEGNRAAQELSRQSDTVTVQDSDVEYRRR